MVQRRPVRSGGPPGCWGRYRHDDQDCHTCFAVAGCRRASKRLSARSTIAEAAQDACRRSEDVPHVDPVDLADYAQREFDRRYDKTTRRFVRWNSRKEWRDAMALVVAACREARWDPRTYVRSQIETVGWSCAENGYAMRGGMFTSANARVRFLGWVARNKKRYGDEKRDRSLSDDESLVAGEIVFGETYLQGGRVDEACDTAESAYPSWSRRKTRSRADVRIRALDAVLSGLDPALPSRMLVPRGRWRWVDVRRFLRRHVFAERKRTEHVDLDPRHGIGLL